MKKFKAIQIFIEGLKVTDEFTVMSHAINKEHDWDVFRAWVKNNKSGNMYMIDSIGYAYIVDGSFENDSNHQRQIHCENLDELMEVIDESNYYAYHYVY